MGFAIRRRNEPIFPFKKCLCMDNRQGAFVATIFVLVSILIRILEFDIYSKII